MLKLIDTVNMPTWALSYIINGDATGMEPDDIKTLQDWLEGNDYNLSDLTFAPLYDDMQSFLTGWPEFGLPCECVEYRIYKWEPK